MNNNLETLRGVNMERADVVAWLRIDAAEYAACGAAIAAGALTEAADAIERCEHVTGRASDSDRHPNGRRPKGSGSEATRARAEGIAQPIASPKGGSHD